MSSHDQEPIFSNDGADIIIMPQTAGDSTRRPLSGARRKRIQEQLEKEAELRRLMEQMKNADNTDSK